MTAKQIEEYEYCKRHLNLIKSWKLPFQSQIYGCGHLCPDIEYKLAKIHRDMDSKITGSIEEARQEINKIIENL